MGRGRGRKRLSISRADAAAARTSSKEQWERGVPTLISTPNPSQAPEGQGGGNNRSAQQHQQRMASLMRRSNSEEELQSHQGGKKRRTVVRERRHAEQDMRSLFRPFGHEFFAGQRSPSLTAREATAQCSASVLERVRDSTRQSQPGSTERPPGEELEAELALIHEAT